jgi:acyl-coenzyme A synthetase/AMP-(fatty) acid ligase
VNVIVSVDSQIGWFAVERAAPDYDAVTELAAVPMSDSALERTIDPFFVLCDGRELSDALGTADICRRWCDRRTQG